MTLDQVAIEYKPVIKGELPLQEERCFYHQPLPARFKVVHTDGTVSYVTLDGHSYKIGVCAGCLDKLEQGEERYSWAKLNGIKER